MSLPIGGRIGPYAIEATIGHGGMGDVYRARDMRLDRRVALKVLLPKLVHDSSFRDRFNRESHLLAAIEHPRIVPIYDAGEIEGVLFIAMRYVEGPDLGSVIASSGPMAPERSAAIVEQIADALDAAHAVGLVHRDVKPANILGAADRDVYLSDFGLTKRTASESGLTQIGMFVGTPGYVAPEQIEGRPLDGRTDQYALACVLHACLTGEEPYRKDSDMAVLWAHLTAPPPLITDRRPELPSAIDDVLARGIAKNQADRFDSCGDFAAAASAALGLAEGAWRQSFRRPTRDAPPVAAAPVETPEATRLADAPTPVEILETTGLVDIPTPIDRPTPSDSMPTLRPPSTAFDRAPQMPTVDAVMLDVGEALRVDETPPVEPDETRPVEPEEVTRVSEAPAPDLGDAAAATLVAPDRPDDAGIAAGPMAAGPMAAGPTVLADGHPQAAPRPAPYADQRDAAATVQPHRPDAGTPSDRRLLRIGPVHVIGLLIVAIAIGLLASVWIAGSLALP